MVLGPDYAKVIPAQAGIDRDFGSRSPGIHKIDATGILEGVDRACPRAEFG